MAGLVTTEGTKALAHYARACASWYLGDVGAARRTLANDSESGDTLPMSRLHRLSLLALIEAWSGSLTVATQYAARARRLARLVLTEEHPYLVISELATAHVLLERGDMPATNVSLAHVAALNRELGLDLYSLMLALEQAWAALASGAPQRGLDILKAGSSRVGTPPLLEARGRALEARCLLALGDVRGAEERIADGGAGALASADVASFSVQLALANEDTAGARRKLEQWADDEEFQHRLARRMWAATIDFVEGEVDAGVEQARHVMALAEHEGQVRMFLDAGPDVRRLLRVISREPSRFAARLLEAEFAPRSSMPLSPREHAVLQQLVNRLSYAEISERLFISHNTVKSHAKSIYTKLGASGRNEAIERAQQLGLI
jgi:LuxR family maltose regulon positive regulatory protein